MLLDAAEEDVLAYMTLPKEHRCLSLEWFRNRTEASVVIERWRRHYNEDRPHSSLRYLTPMAYKATITSGQLTGDPASAIFQ